MLVTLKVRLSDILLLLDGLVLCADKKDNETDLGSIYRLHKYIHKEVREQLNLKAEEVDDEHID